MHASMFPIVKVPYQSPRANIIDIHWWNVLDRRRSWMHRRQCHKHEDECITLRKLYHFCNLSLQTMLWVVTSFTLWNFLSLTLPHWALGVHEAMGGTSRVGVPWWTLTLWSIYHHTCFVNNHFHIIMIALRTS